MAVSDDQMVRAVQYTNFVLGLLNDRLGNGYDIRAERTMVTVKHKTDYMHGKISIREEGAYSKLSGNGKLYIVVDTPRRHGKMYRETKENFEKQFERAVDLLVSDIENEKKYLAIRKSKDKIYDQAKVELAQKLGIEHYFDWFHPKARARVVVKWNGETDEYYPTVKFSVDIVDIEMDKADEVAHKILDLLHELDQ